MKQVLSMILALILAFSSLGAGMAAIAAENPATNELATHLDAQIKGAAAFVFKGTTTFTEQNAIDFLTYINAGADTAPFKENFAKSVKDNLDANSGKIIIAGEEWYEDTSKPENDPERWQSYSYSYEDIGIYSAIIRCLKALGYNPADFEGYDITAAFKAIDTTATFNIYNYKTALLEADSAFAEALALKFVNEHYTLKRGANYYANNSGQSFYNCDNTCQFITALANYQNDEWFKRFIEDAKAVVQTYTKDNGAYCDDEWGKDVNANSTALAMMAYAALGEMETAYTYYKNLVLGFESSVGVFQTEGTDNLYATKDALLALEYFKDAVVKTNFEHQHLVPETVTVNATTAENGSIGGVCRICGNNICHQIIYSPSTVLIAKSAYTYTGKEIQPQVTVKDNQDNVIAADNYTVEYFNQKNVGKATIKVYFNNSLYNGTLTKTFKILPKKAKKFKVTAKKGKCVASWKKQTAQISGYQLQYAEKKNFKKKKTVTLKKNTATKKTIKKLKSKKTYYVRIRTYKTVQGKKYYSDWSAVKKVKIK